MKWTSASASHILVKNKLLANSIKSNIKNYNDFRELAKEYSVCPTHRMEDTLVILYLERWF